MEIGHSQLRRFQASRVQTHPASVADINTQHVGQIVRHDIRDGDVACKMTAKGQRTLALADADSPGSAHLVLLFHTLSTRDHRHNPFLATLQYMSYGGKHFGTAISICESVPRAFNHFVYSVKLGKRWVRLHDGGVKKPRELVVGRWSQLLIKLGLAPVAHSVSGILKMLDA